MIISVTAHIKKSSIELETVLTDACNVLANCHDRLSDTKNLSGRLVRKMRLSLCE